MKIVNLKDVAPLKNKTVEKFNGEKNYIATGNLDDNQKASFKKITFKNRPSRAQLTVNENDICFARMKNTSKVLLINKNNDHNIFSTGFAVIKPDKKKILPEYLYYLIKSEIFQKIKDMYCTGATQKSIVNNKINKIKISLPFIQKQQSIITKLKTTDNLINLRSEYISKLDEFSNSIFDEMFGNTIINEKKWDEKILKDVISEKPCNGIFRKNDDYGEGIPVFWVEDLFKSHKLEIDNTRKLNPSAKELKKYSLNYGDLLFCRSSLKRDGIGYNNIFLGSNASSLFECHIIRVRLNQKLIDPIFANFLLRTPASRKNIIKHSKTSTMTTIDQNSLLKTKIFLPPINMQKKFSSIFIKLCDLKEKHLQNLATSKKLSQVIQKDEFIAI